MGWPVAVCPRLVHISHIGGVWRALTGPREEEAVNDAQRGSLGVVAGAASHQDLMKMEPLPRELRIRDQPLRKLDPLAPDPEVTR